MARTATPTRTASAGRAVSASRTASATRSPVLVYPPDTTLTYVATPVVSLPGYLSPITDPTWATRVTRVGDSVSYGHNYAKRCPWSPDGAMMLLYNTTSGERQVLDGNTYAVLYTTSNINSGSIWPNTVGNAGKLLTTRSTKTGLHWYNVAADNWTEIHTFAGYAGLEIGNGEGNIDDNDRYIALQGTNGGVNTVIVYDIIADSVIATKTFTVAPNWVGMSHSGLYCVVQFNSSQGTGTGAEQGTWLFANTLGTALRQLSTLGGYHADFAYDTSGNEVLVDCPAGGDDTKMHRLSDGTETIIFAGVPSGSTANAFRRGHVSGRALDLRDWAFYSVYDNLAGGQAGLRGLDQLVAVRLDGSPTPTVRVFAHTHHGADVSVNDPFAAPNRDGTRVAFRSEWDATDQYEYVATA